MVLSPIYFIKTIAVFIALWLGWKGVGKIGGTIIPLSLLFGRHKSSALIYTIGFLILLDFFLTGLAIHFIVSY